eukprot:gb/GECH01011115.1/.p1 GENE.gb/GECH01011115.1/~~gb/GECH01011115.1/.p1  ORF type:complete len:198 (+),score=17.22 gb/GECH01011115.1/:1-594(+)
MKDLLTKQTVEIPDNVSISTKSRMVTVKGPRGELTRNFKHININLYVSTSKDEEDNVTREAVVEVYFGKKKQRAAVRTICSHIQNMITGVTKGYRYKMRFVYAHFPVNCVISDSGDNIEIRNFLGEKVVRRVTVPEGVKIIKSKNKDEIHLEGNDIERVSRGAALIHQSTLVHHKDIRKFLDGVYVSSKGPIQDEEE